MAAKELETTTAELAAGRYELRASATRTVFDGFARVYTEGTRRPTADEEAEGTLPALAEGDADRPCATSRRRSTSPSRRRASPRRADQGARGARHRPAVDLRGDDLDDRRPRLRPVEERRLHPEPVGEVVTDLLVEHFGDYVDLEFTAQDGGGPRRRSPAASAPGCRSCEASTRRSATASTRSQERRAVATSRPRRRDEVCSLGHPMVIRLGRNGRVPGLLAVPGAQGVAAAAGRGAATAPRPRGRRGRRARSAAWARSSASAAGSGRSSAATATPTAATSSARARRRPPPLAVRGHLPEERSDGHLVARRARRTGNVFWGCSRLPEMRLHDQPRADRRAPRRRRRRAGRAAPARRACA